MRLEVSFFSSGMIEGARGVGDHKRPLPFATRCDVSVETEYASLLAAHADAWRGTIVVVVKFSTTP